MKRFIAAMIGFKLWLLIVAATLFVSSTTVESQSADPARTIPTPVTEKISRPTSEPYRGDLSIFEGAEREKNLQVERIMDVLLINEGKSVADIGAGSGWFTVRAAKRVGTDGKVYAVEINPDSIAYINKRAVSEGFKNIATILGKTDDPTLPANSVDAVLILKTYHEFAEPVAIMKKVKPAMKKGGLVGIIDRTGDGADHGLDEATVIREMKLAGFSLKEKHDFVKGDNMDYFLVFQVGQ
jgi:cyclopropane fatty-acyl-phospholipid synthase-like methyltransferase